MTVVRAARLLGGEDCTMGFFTRQGIRTDRSGWTLQMDADENGATRRALLCGAVSEAMTGGDVKAAAERAVRTMRALGS